MLELMLDRIRAITINTTQLDLSGIDFSKSSIKFSDDYTKKSLPLAESKKDFDEMIALIKSIPSHIRTISLASCKLNKFDFNSMLLLLKAIPSTSMKLI